MLTIVSEGCVKGGTHPKKLGKRARSQGSNPWQTQIIALGGPLLSHFPLDPIAYLRYKTSIGLTL
jgi:hypothetical protein